MAILLRFVGWRMVLSGFIVAVRDELRHNPGVYCTGLIRDRLGSYTRSSECRRQRGDGQSRSARLLRRDSCERIRGVSLLFARARLTTARRLLGTSAAQRPRFPSPEGSCAPVQFRATFAKGVPHRAWAMVTQRSLSLPPAEGVAEARRMCGSVAPRVRMRHRGGRKRPAARTHLEPRTR
jgi:hypothetical protein